MCFLHLNISKRNAADKIPKYSWQTHTQKHENKQTVPDFLQIKDLKIIRLHEIHDFLG